MELNLGRHLFNVAIPPFLFYLFSKVTREFVGPIRSRSMPVESNGGEASLVENRPNIQDEFEL
jgi:hypothetical protein